MRTWVFLTRSRLTALGLVLALLLIMPLNVAAAKDKDPRGLSVPVAGTFTDQAGGVGKFTGTLTISRFAVVNNRIHVIGVITGDLTDSSGNVIATGLQLVSLPVTLASGPTAPARAAGRPAEQPKSYFIKAGGAPATAAPPAQLSCEILRLSIGAINLDLLGLQVSLSPVLLVITAVPGAGNLLGNLLCAIAGLLDGVGPLAQIVNLLNQLLALLAAL